MLKTDRYYDVGCDYCGKHMSTDYGLGMAETPNQARSWAKEIGFKTKYNKNICPECLQNKAYLDVDESEIESNRYSSTLEPNNVRVIRPNHSVPLTPEGIQNELDKE